MILVLNIYVLIVVMIHVLGFVNRCKMTEVPFNQRTYPKKTVQLTVTKDPDCFGEYTKWPCEGYGNRGPCTLAARCKEAKGKTVFKT